MNASEIPGYVIAQLMGAAIAAHTGQYLLPFIGDGASIIDGSEFDFIAGTVAEFLGTFALVWVILNVATAKSTKGNYYYDVAIGFTVMGCSYIFGGISGAAFNPAVAAGSCLSGMAPWANMGGFLICQLLAAATAAYIFNYVNGAN